MKFKIKKNLIYALVSQIITFVLNFVSQSIFIKSLGSEYLGINTLFANIISVLNITELGISTAIVYNLYKPLSENNKSQIKRILKFYKRCYIVIALIILFLSISIIPFLKSIVGNNNISENIYLIFVLFTAETIISYLLTYKRSIIYADQNNYLILKSHIVYLFLLHTSQIIVLVNFKNYYMYLIIKILCTVIENLIISLIANKKYPYIKEKCNESITKQEKQNFFKNIKGLFLHKISWTIISSTDSIIISTMCGLKIVGFYSNYALIMNAIEQVISQILSSTTATIGNLLVNSTKEKIYKTYKQISFVSFVLCTWFTVCFYLCSKSFIKIISGSPEYVLSNSIVIIISFKFFLQIMRRSICIFKDASGIFYEDRHIAIIATIVNLVASIILTYFFGIIGVFIGTILCYLIFHLFGYSKYVYQKIFCKDKKIYIFNLVKYTIILFICFLISNTIDSFIQFNNEYVNFIKSGIIATVISFITIFTCFKDNEEYKYFIGEIKRIIKRIIKKI